MPSSAPETRPLAAAGLSPGITRAAEPAAEDEVDAFVTFGLDRSVVAISVRHVREVLDGVELSHLPNAPHGVMGLIDVRGESLAVVSLRAKLGFPSRPSGTDERILILEIGKGGQALVLGVLADCVFEVTPLTDAPTDGAPRLGVAWDSRFIAGIARRHGRFVVILDVARVFTENDLASLGALLQDEGSDAPLAGYR